MKIRVKTKSKSVDQLWTNCGPCKIGDSRGPQGFRKVLQSKEQVHKVHTVFEKFYNIKNK